MYFFKDKVNYTRFFWFQKTMIKNKVWKLLSPAAKSVWPVLAAYANKKAVSWPGEETISALSGRSAKTVRQGLRDLDGFPGLICVKPYITPRGRQSKKFFLKLPRRCNGNAFVFHRSIIDSGMWSQLGRKRPTAQALYPVMRAFSYADYNYIEDEFSERAFDICEADRSVLIDHAGLSRWSFEPAVDSLTEYHLINYDNETGLYHVYLHPTDPESGNYMLMKRSFLNEQMANDQAGGD